MDRRLFAALAASALMIAMAVPAGALAAKPTTRGFDRVDVNKLDKTLLGKFLAGGDVDVIVELGGTAASARGISRQQQVVAARQLKATQDRLDGKIKSLGGKVQAKYQYAMDGIKLRVNGKKLAALAKLPGVQSIRPVVTYQLDNARSVPFIGAHQAWTDYGATGSGQTIAVIDSGIDYTHANFGGPGTTDAYDDNDSDTIADGGFPTAKVIGGWDFVGDEYDPEHEDGTEIPAPDPDPLDCNGHGSHVSGSAAGFGVKADHTTYTGPYNANTYKTSFGIGPGVAPKAKLVALKIFGCEGGTSVVTDALEWVAEYNASHTDAIDVVNMSLGGIGGGETADSLMVDALVASGVSVVTSTGNEGPNAYMTGAPGNATGALATAAVDVVANLPGAVIDRATLSDLNAINENAFPGLPVSGTLRFITDDPNTGTPQGEGDEHLGCVASDYGTLPANSIAIIQRGFCTFVEKGAAAEEAGAVGVIVYNRDDIADPNEFPTFIGYTPAEFDIPMIGIGRGAKATLAASNGTAATLKTGPSIPNPTFLNNADFSSGGPRLGDSANKPDVSAPGVNIVSTAVGLGYKGTTLSGTSMASPHVAGVAALVRQRHPTWRAEVVKAVIVGTAVQTKVSPFNARIAGSGMVQPRRAVDSVAFVLAQDSTPSLSFGYDPLRVGTYTETKSFTIYNTSSKPITYKLTAPSFLTLDRTTITVPARTNRTVLATAKLSSAQLAASKSASQTAPDGTAWGSLVNYGGIIKATPTVAGTGRYPLTITYRAVPRAASNIVASKRSAFGSVAGVSTATVRIANNGVRAGYADVYAWGLSDPRDLPSAVTATNDIRAVGVQVLPAEVLTGEADPDDASILFAINTWGRWSGGFQNVFTINVFGAGPEPEFQILTFDLGLLTEDDFNGQVVSVVLNADSDIVDAWVADAPANGSTIIVPLLASDIDRDHDGATIDYEVEGENINDASEPADGFVDEVSGRASFSVFDPAVSQGDFIKLDRGQATNLLLQVAETEFADHPVKGWMVVTLDDMNGAAQADLVPVTSADLPD